MARRVYHFKNPGYPSHSEGLPYGKTMCNREATRRYHFVSRDDVVENSIPQHYRICPRCLERAVRVGLLQPEHLYRHSNQDENNTNTNNSNSERTEEQHNQWLSRLGIT